MQQLQRAPAHSASWAPGRTSRSENGSRAEREQIVPSSRPSSRPKKMAEMVVICLSRTATSWPARRRRPAGRRRRSRALVARTRRLRTEVLGEDDERRRPEDQGDVTQPRRIHSQHGRRASTLKRRGPARRAAAGHGASSPSYRTLGGEQPFGTPAGEAVGHAGQVIADDALAAARRRAAPGEPRPDICSGAAGRARRTAPAARARPFSAIARTAVWR